MGTKKAQDSSLWKYHRAFKDTLEEGSICQIDFIIYNNFGPLTNLDIFIEIMIIDFPFFPALTRMKDELQHKVTSLC